MRFYKLIIPKLSQLRKNADLTQLQVAQRMKLKPKSGQTFIARLENELIKAPRIDTILNYLDAIGVSWITFFTELSNERDKQEHAQIMTKVTLPSGVRIQKKLDRDTRLYEAKIRPPQNFYTKVDMELVKQKITLKVLKYLNTLRVDEKLIPHYLEFAHKVITVDKYAPLIKEYNISGVSKSYLTEIMNIALKIEHTEEKKVQAQKPITRQKVRDMAHKYVQARIKLVPVENAVNRLLVEHNLSQSAYYTGYMNFARECYRVIKKYQGKDDLILKQKLVNLYRVYTEQGLDKEIAEKIKLTVLKLYNVENKN